MWPASLPPTPWVGAFYGTIPDVEVLGAASAILHAFGPCSALHLVDATITGHHLRSAHQAIRQGVYKDMATLVNQQALDWILHTL